jgi:hypothetical protein
MFTVAEGGLDWSWTSAVDRAGRGRGRAWGQILIFCTDRDYVQKIKI